MKNKISKICGNKIWMGILILLGTILRIGSCFYGYPYRLHPDESVIVENAIDIINRHTYEPSGVEWPAHFLMKLSAVLFNVFSWVRYGMSPVEVFGEHTTVFYVIARFVVALFGILMIPLSYYICQEVYPKSGKYVAMLVTVFPTFVINSGFATPDIPLTFMTMLASYFSILFLKKENNKKYLYFLCIVTGVAITIKYTAAILCILIAITIGVKYWKNSKLDIVRYGMLAILIVLISAFFVAPNLFTNWQLVLETLEFQSRSTHVGADGLGFLGNLKYYLQCYIGVAGWLALIFSAVGMIGVWKKAENKIYLIGLYVGIIFLASISVMALHWERWGLPVYINFIMLAGMGICYLKEELSISNIKGRTTCAIMLTIIFVAALTSSSMRYLMQSTLSKCESRIAALEFVKNNDIAEAESIYEGYTPFLMSGAKDLDITRDTEGKLVLPENKKDAKYIILSSNMYGRYYNEPERYAEKVAVYEKIKGEYELIYKSSLIDGNAENGKWCIMKFIYNLKDIYGMLYKGDCYGMVIEIYKIND